MCRSCMCDCACVHDAGVGDYGLGHKTAGGKGRVVVAHTRLEGGGGARSAQLTVSLVICSTSMAREPSEMRMRLPGAMLLHSEA